jgi:hypothetical protein
MPFYGFDHDRKWTKSGQQQAGLDAPSTRTHHERLHGRLFDLRRSAPRPELLISMAAPVHLGAISVMAVDAV